MNPIEKLNGKKGLLAIALLMAVVMMLPFAVQYYSWKATYSIIPLTSEDMSIDIGSHTGATKLKTITYDAKDITVPAGKKLDIYFFVKDEYVNTIKGHFYSLKFKYYNVDSAFTPVTDELTTSEGTESNIDLSGSWVKITVDNSAGQSDLTLDMKIDIDGWTFNVESSTGTVTFYVWVYAVEL